MACFAVSSACVSCSIAWLFACIFFSNVATLCCACIKLSCACSTSFLILITLAFVAFAACV
jgi:3-isopropylmalate dehydratase small subunit